MTRFWLSWYDRDPDPRPLHDPPNEAVLGWWISGSTDEETIICAVVSASTEDEAWDAVAIDWPFETVRRRFCEDKGPSFVPGDRFPTHDRKWCKRRFSKEAVKGEG